MAFKQSCLIWKQDRIRFDCNYIHKTQLGCGSCASSGGHLGDRYRGKQGQGFFMGIIYNQVPFLQVHLENCWLSLSHIQGGSATLLLLLASHSVETYCLHADWIFALWGVKLPSRSKALLQSFTQVLVGESQIKAVAFGWLLFQTKLFVFVSGPITSDEIRWYLMEFKLLFSHSEISIVQ